MVDTAVRDAIAESSLGKLPPEVIERIVAEGDLVDYPAGAIIYRGEKNPRPRLVVSGLLRTYIESAEGRQVTILYARHGEFLGSAVIAVPSLNVSVQALRKSSLLGISASTIREAAQHDARVGWPIIQHLARKLQEVIAQLAINAFGNIRERVAWHLLDLACKEPFDGRAPLVANVSQQELADAVGSVREVVSRELAELRNHGIIATSAGRIEILDPERLEQEARVGTVTPVTSRRH